MASQHAHSNDWTRPLPRMPMTRPTWRRGQDGDTAIKIPMPQEPPENIIEVSLSRPSEDITKRLKRPFFTAFNAVEAQDAALAKHQPGYDHDLPLQYGHVPARKRRDSIRDESSQSTSTTTSSSESTAQPSTPPLPEAPRRRPEPPAIILTTEGSTQESEESPQVPKELEIDGNAGFDPHHASSNEPPRRRKYRYKGRWYELQGDEPPEWLEEVKEVEDAPSGASRSSPHAGHHNRSSLTPSSMRSGMTTRSRRSLQRGSSGGLDEADRRRSGRYR